MPSSLSREWIKLWDMFSIISSELSEKEKYCRLIITYDNIYLKLYLRNTFIQLSNLVFVSKIFSTLEYLQIGLAWLQPSSKYYAFLKYHRSFFWCFAHLRHRNGCFGLGFRWLRYLTLCICWNLEYCLNTFSQKFDVCDE